MAEYNPSKIIKDGNTYNFRDTTKIPLAGSNEISGSLIPSTDGTVNLGSSSYQWNNAYIKSLTINGVACGDILTHNADEFASIADVTNKANTSDLAKYLPLTGGFIIGNIGVNSTSGGWVHGFDWLYNNERYAYIHPLIDEASGTKSLIFQADSGIKINAYLFQNNLFRHDLDNYCDLGTAQNRFKDIYATNATINTSDRNAKQDIAVIDDNILEAWDNVSLVSFKFKDAVEKKGDEARLHTGYIAQNIQEELNKHGIDACDYGLFCYNSWDAQEEKSHEEERTDEAGNITTVKVIDTPAVEAGETYGLRYIECLVVECAYLRKKNKELDDRITKLEKNLNA